VTVTLSEIKDEVHQVVGRWRSQTSTEQRNDLLIWTISWGELDDVDTGSGTTAEMVADLQCDGRDRAGLIGIMVVIVMALPQLTNESTIQLGAEPAPTQP